MDEKKKNGKIAHQRIVAARRILRDLGRNNDSPGTGIGRTICKLVEFRVLFTSSGNTDTSVSSSIRQLHQQFLTQCGLGKVQ
jgi:hypothetical protein